ncbi:pre-mRNA-splicing factor ATP-dependent RNA helicase Prp22p [Trichomonascus vanleenenianus]|uniref:DEAH-box ATP-dependent RNA helicase PRP22 n=1 Tax=Trichomonascus vanleenenianus TaxID=2268995 RepID=UPI003EC9BAD6
MDTLQRLEVISLVSKLTNEIGEFIGEKDKTLAEFVLDLHEKGTANERNAQDGLIKFKKLLDENEAPFPEEFVNKMDRMIRDLHPRLKKKQPDPVEEYDKPRENDAKKPQLRSGLSLPDDYQRAERLRDEVQQDDLRGSDDQRYPYEPRYKGRYKREEENRGRSREVKSAPWRQEIHDKPELGKIYDARVVNLKEYGAFANLLGFSHKTDGLIHISEITSGPRLQHPSEILERDQEVKVKVIRLDNNRVSLSMKQVDQTTGEDLTVVERSNGSSNGEGSKPTKRKRLTSPERWELRQLKAAGASVPELDEDDAADDDEDNDDSMEPEEDVDIEIREEEPAFLKGQTKHRLELSPIRIVKAPDGSLNRTAMSGAKAIRERIEERRKEKIDKEREMKKKMATQLVDPLASGANAIAPGSKEATADAFSNGYGGSRSRPKTLDQVHRTSMTIAEQRRSLPVYDRRDQFIQAVRDNQVLVVIGETGSGKTTQITQYLVEEGFSEDGMIGCTQPRRIAAQSVAQRVAEEVGCPVGEEVGYNVRFDDKTSSRTKIKYMTDGMLQREALLDPNMSQYSVIILDEAHERTIATDVLFALLKKAAKQRPDLRVIVTSATLDADKFSRYFFDCKVFEIPGRTHEVQILYTKEPEFDYVEAALTTVMQIHVSEPAGDILVFLTGREEIETGCEVLEERLKALGPDIPELIVLPLFSQMPQDLQTRIFEPAPKGSRKVILATNIAETSITVDGIYYVVDPGFVKMNAYDPKIGMDKLLVSPISQAQANQRAGRAGRTGPGKCYRLYTEQAFQTEMLPATIPEIQRQNLAHTILMLKAMGINDLLNFDFMDPPPTNTMLTALEELYQLNALDQEGLLTRLGRRMADFPMEPALSKVCIASVDAKCSDEVLTIVAMITAQNVFYRPRDKQKQADERKARFHDATGDHMTLLNVYNAWVRSGRSKMWCQENFIQDRTIRRAQDVKDQLVRIMRQSRQPIISCNNNSETIRKTICSGFFYNSARKNDQEEGYKTLLEQTAVSLHPSSALWTKSAQFVIYHTLILTSKEYMSVVSTVEPKWLVEVAPTFFKVSDPRHLSKRKKSEKIQPLFNRFEGKDEWRISNQRRGRGGSTRF